MNATETAHYIEAGQHYEFTDLPGTADVRAISVDEDGNTQLRVREHGPNEDRTLSVDLESFRELILDGDLTLAEEAAA